MPFTESRSSQSPHPPLTRLPDVCPLTEFREDTASILKRLKKSPRPLLVTQDGRAAAIVMSPATFDRLADELEEARQLRLLHQSFEDVTKGRVRPAEDAFDDLLAKHGSKRTAKAR